MKAIVHERYGPEGVEFRDVPIPEVDDDHVLVSVRASSVNPLEWYEVYAPVFFRALGRHPRRPGEAQLGTDVAGTVEAVGGAVTGLVPGDEVFGTAVGAWAEHAVASPGRLAKKPASLAFGDAAAMPIAALTALQGLRDVGGVRPGHRVLVNGASGGVGTYAVQLAKALGAEVTAVCSPRNVEQTRGLGADRVVDYTTEDFTKLALRHEVVLDVAGSRSFNQLRRVCTPDAVVVVVGARMRMSVLGPLKHIASSKVQSLAAPQRARFFVARIEPADLEVLAGLAESGTIRSVVDRRYALSAVTEALAYLGEGHARGKVVIDV